MKIPKKVKIGPSTYTITESKGVAEQGSVLGSLHVRTLTIYIDPRLPQQQKELTFFHEVLHACLRHAGLHHLMEDKQEEQIVDSLSCGLYQVLKSNRLLK